MYQSYSGSTPSSVGAVPGGDRLGAGAEPGVQGRGPWRCAGGAGTLWAWGCPCSWTLGDRGGQVAAGGGGLGGAGLEDPGHRVVRSAAVTQSPYLAFTRHLPGDVRAAVGLVGRQPGRGVAVALAPVGRASTASRLSGSLAKADALGRRPATARPSARRRTGPPRGRCRRWSCPPRTKRDRLPVYGSARVPRHHDAAVRAGRIRDPVRSRRRMSLRVSQPLRSASTQACPNRSRA